MAASRMALLVLLGGCCGCSVQGQNTAPPTSMVGPTIFATNQNGVDFGEASLYPDDGDSACDSSGSSPGSCSYESQAGPQMHFRLSRAYCDMRSGTQQSAADQASFFCVPDAVTIDDSHPPSSTPNKNFLIVPYKDGMNMDYPGGIEINSVFVGIHPNFSRCVAADTYFLTQDSCQASGMLWAEDNHDFGGLFATAYATVTNGLIDPSHSFVLIASDTYQHTSHGDMLLLVRDAQDNFRFQFGGEGGAENPAQYKNWTRARIDSTGKGYFDGGTQVGGADFAESVGAAGKKADYAPGDVLVIDTNSDRRFSLSTSPYSTLAAGIYSTRPGVVGALHSSEDPQLMAEIPMAMMGIVPCKVSSENGPIARGDLLVTSSTPGYAMRGTDKARLPGAIIGKALQPLTAGKGQIEVLVTLR